MNINEITIQELIKNRVKTPADLVMIKRKMAKRYKIPCPSNINLAKAYHKMVRNKRVKLSEKLNSLLRARPIRSLSGIVNVSVLTKSYPCPGKCIYCPKERGIPKSYLSGEPAVERAKRLNYNPYSQVKKRVEMLKIEGHPTDKIELRIIGGTWSFYPQSYQTWFIKRCFDACNEVNGETLEKAQKLNEKAKHRIVGLSVETRPDFITEKEVESMRKLGITRVELGVQTVYDDILSLNKRGHKVEATIKATKLLKDAGVKVGYQMMPNLPGSNLERDEETFEELFSNPNFQPDLLKIYPTALLKEAPLYKWWKAGKYRPYSDKALISLIKSIKKKIPYYVRIQRIIRDIPAQRIVAGPAKISNLRQIIARDSEKEGWKCRCIRCREVRENYDPEEKIYLFRKDYAASEGKEVFLSFENKNRTRLYSLLRLRIPSCIFNKGGKDCSRSFIPVLKDAAIIREVHTYGQQLSLNRNSSSVISPQHKGLGKKLIKEAEKIVKKEFGLNKIAVITGIGARDYFRKLKYKLKGTYMIKKSSSNFLI